MRFLNVILIIFSALTLSACDLNDLEHRLKDNNRVSEADQTCSGSASDDEVLQYEKDVSLKAALEELNGRVSAREMWGAFPFTETLLADSIKEQYSDIPIEFRSDFDRIVAGVFPAGSTITIYQGPYWDVSRHRCSKQAFFVRLETRHKTNQGYDQGYSIRVGHDVAEGDDGLPEPMPAPAPTPQPSKTPSP